jgi:hypothetical protein
MGIGDFIGMRWVLWGEDGVPSEIVDAMMQFIQFGLIGADSRKEADTGKRA